MTEPSAQGRRRVFALAALAAAAIVVVVLAVVVLAGSGDDNGRSDTAAQLVPPGAQLYLHAVIDEQSRQWRDGQRLVTRLPSLRRLLEEQLARLGTGASPVELQARIRPWLDNEAALALLPGRRQATSLILLSVRDRAGAQSFLNTWISKYVISNDDAPFAMKAQRPLKEARIDVMEIPGKPGAYRAVAFMRPHFQLDELSMSMRLVAELPPPAK